MQPVTAAQLQHRAHRLAGDQRRRRDLAAPHLLERLKLRHADFFDLDAERVEEVAHRVAGAAALGVEVDLETAQLLDRRDVGPGDEMDLFIEQLGDVDDLVFGLPHAFIGAAEVVEDAGLRQADVDAAQVAHVADVARAANAGDRQDAQAVIVVEHLGEIVGYLEVGVARIGAAGDDADRILVGLLVPVDADADEIIAHALDPAGYVVDRIGDRIGPAIVAPAVIGRGRGNPDPFPCDEFPVLIFQINKMLASDGWKQGISHIRAVREPVHPGIQVAVDERLVVDGLESRIRPVLPELFLHTPGHRSSLVPGAELDGEYGLQGRRDERSPKNQGREKDRDKTHGSSLDLDGPGLAVQGTSTKAVLRASEKTGCPLSRQYGANWVPTWYL